MDADLTEIALNALESAETADKGQPETEEEDSSEGASEEPGKETDGNDGVSDDNSGDEGSEGKGEKDDSGDGSTTDGGGDGSDSDGGDSDPDSGELDKQTEKKDEKKSDEISDEEFEELAKKRGYAKQPSDTEKQQAETKAKEEKDQLERLTRKPSEIPEDVWADTPTNNKIVYNKLPIITARGENGQTVNVKLPSQLPPNFQFADERARQEFVAAVQQQTNTMNQMLTALNNRDEQVKQENARREEAKMVVSEISRLQKAGLLPSPKAKPDDANFGDDPAVKVINNVLSYRIQRASQGVNLSVEDAFKLYRADHPDEFVSKTEKKDSTKAKGDEERKQIAKKISGNKKATERTVSDTKSNAKKYYHYGMSTQDVLDRALQDLD